MYSNKSNSYFLFVHQNIFLRKHLYIFCISQCMKFERIAFYWDELKGFNQMYRLVKKYDAVYVKIWIFLFDRPTNVSSITNTPK